VPIFWVFLFPFFDLSFGNFCYIFNLEFLIFSRYPSLNAHYTLFIRLVLKLSFSLFYHGGGHRPTFREGVIGGHGQMLSAPPPISPCFLYTHIYPKKGLVGAEPPLPPPCVVEKLGKIQGFRTGIMNNEQ
jgi:hypothetical protein